MNRTRVVVAILLAVVVGDEANAQALSPADCASIEANVVANPAGVDSLWMLRQCPEFPSTMASLLDGGGIYADSLAFDAVVAVAGSLREAAIFDWAATTAADGSEPLLRRLAAAWVVVKYLTPGAPYVNLRQLQGYSGSTEGCILIGGEPSQPGHVDIAPSAQSVGRLLAITLGEAGQPIPLRYLANCLRVVTRMSGDVLHYRETGVNEAPFNPATDVEFGTLCGRRVFVRNKSTHFVSMRLVWGANAAEIANNNQARQYTVGPRGGGQAFHEVIWQVPSPAATKFRIQQVITLGGSYPYVTIVAIETLDGTPCP